MNIKRYGTTRVHLPNQDGKPLCDQQYAHAPDYFKQVDQEANCKRCLKRQEGLATQAAEPEVFSHEDLLQRVKDAYERALDNRFASVAAEGVPWVVRDDVKRLLRQAIEQAFDNGHACAGHHQPD